MMNGHGKSDNPTVPTKPLNKAGPMTVAEKVEGKGLAKGKTQEPNTCRTQCRDNVQQRLERIRKVAKKDKGLKFTALMHHIYDIETLKLAYLALKRDASPGIDGETWRHYGENLDESLRALSGRLKRGGYRAKAVKRTFIPKADGRQRPLGVTALEDKIVQRATVEVLNAIYETEFLGFSYGYRPGKSQHNALDALYTGCLTKYVNWVLDCDIRSFFDTIDHEWLVKMLRHRIADERVIRLIQKWLKAGVLEDGKWREVIEGTPQGGSASPFLANVYLHYAFDTWIRWWRKHHAHGDVIIVRWADDIVVGFQRWSDAVRFRAELVERFRKFRLELHPEKTRLLEFGPFAIGNRKRRDQGKVETFDFLGFTHICGKKRGNGMYTIFRRTIKKRLRAKLREVKIELRQRMHDPIPDVGAWLKGVLTGHYRYYAVPMNNARLWVFHREIKRFWFHALKRRSQRSRMTWERMYRLTDRWLPVPTIYHPYPLRRLGVIT